MAVTDIIPRATYHRLRKDRRPLSRGQSEKVLSLSRVFSETLRQYRDDTKLAARFLLEGHPMLDGRTPFDVAKESTAGADLVLKLLARADAGVAV